MTIDSNDIGVAILSTDRPTCLERIIKSMSDHSNMGDLNVFVIDDSNSPELCMDICDPFSKVVFSHTGTRVGIAKNTNYALDALASFPYKLILNNDVEVLRRGWQFFYFLSMHQTGIHHFCFQQEGLWGAGTKKRPQMLVDHNGRTIKTIKDYPQGAILALDQTAFNTVGYFDSENFNGYGKSHWDWSFRISESGIQPEGIHDLVGSNDYFKVHDEPCTTEHKTRIKDYKRNTQVLERLRKEKARIYIDHV